MKRILLSLLFAMSIAFSQNSEAISDLDYLYIGFMAAPRDIPAFGEYIAEFTAIKFWYVTGNQVPDPTQPTSIYSYAWYNPESDSQYNEIPRVAFNGTPLTETVVGTGYYMKRPPDGDENWLSWYAYLGEDEVVKYFALDTTNPRINNLIPEEARLDLSFPPPYILDIADSFTIGGSSWSYGVSPSPGDFTTPAYGQLKIWPMRTSDPRPVLLDIDRRYSPGAISSSLEPTQIMGEGWEVGTHQGLAGFGACNEDKIGFGQFLFKACSVVIKPVSITVTNPE